MQHTIFFILSLIHVVISAMCTGAVLVSNDGSTIGRLLLVQRAIIVSQLIMIVIATLLVFFA